MGFTEGELVKHLDRKSLETICLCLLMKREYDGLNGRTWDASKHMVWEDRLSGNLRRFDYLGHTGEPVKKPTCNCHPHDIVYHGHSCGRKDNGGTHTIAYTEGREAFFLGQDDDSNPYNETYLDYTEWLRGYVDADAEEAGERE